MKKLQSNMQTQDGSQTVPARRQFCRGVVATGVGLFALTPTSHDSSTKLPPSQRTPKELALHEADFYASHTLAG